MGSMQTVASAKAASLRVMPVRVIGIPSKGGFNASTLDPAYYLRPMHLLFRY
jgi:hypothetical protein